MKKQTLLFTVAVLLSALFITSCGDDTPKTYDENSYIGLYLGQHALADSNTLRAIPGLEDIDVFYSDSLNVTNGGSTTDGKIYAVSSYLNGKSIEIDIAKTSTNITPTLIGSLIFGPVTLTNVKVTSGNATWNTDTTVVQTNLVASVSFGPIDVPNLRINGTFTKQ